MSTVVIGVFGRAQVGVSLLQGSGCKLEGFADAHIGTDERERYAGTLTLGNAEVAVPKCQLRETR